MTSCRFSRTALGAASLALAASAFSASTDPAKPNFVFILLDDMKAVPGYMSEVPGNYLNRLFTNAGVRSTFAQLVTPALNDLATRGIPFQHAVCAATVCNPSRMALLSGMPPYKSGVYSNNDEVKIRTAIPNVVTLPQNLRQSAKNYYTASVGKILHGSSNLVVADYGSSLTNTADWGQLSWTQWTAAFPAVSGGVYGPASRSNWSPATTTVDPEGSGFDFGFLAGGNLEGQPDYQAADVIARLLGTVNTGTALTDVQDPSGGNFKIPGPASRPFFLALGIGKPHLAEYVPESVYRTLFSTDGMSAAEKDDLNAMIADFSSDLGDLAGAGAGSTTTGDMGDLFARADTYGASIGMAAGKRHAYAYREFVRHYLAGCKIADLCIARVMSAVDALPANVRNNTIVIVASDHGYYLGEKCLFGKTKLWDESANSLLVVYDPRASMQHSAGTPRDQLVSLQDLYPTVCTLAGVALPAGSGATRVYGRDFSSLLIASPAAAWNYSSVTTMYANQHRLCYNDASGTHWSYVQNVDAQSNVTEQLYDVTPTALDDPNEILNLAGNASYSTELADMRTRLASKLAESPLN